MEIYRHPTKKEIKKFFREFIKNANREVHEQYMENLRNKFRRTINPNSYTEQVSGFMQMKRQLKKYKKDSHD